METLQFPNGTEDGAIMCTNVDIIEDEIYEKEQHFLVRAVGAERNVLIMDAYTVVVIEDNDGKKYCNCVCVCVSTGIFCHLACFSEHAQLF